MKIKFSDLWRCNGTIDRAPYLVVGVVLFAVKFNLDRAVSFFGFGQSWTILEYQNLGALMHGGSVTQTGQLLTLLAVSLPFLWAGLVLTLNRLRSAGLPLWLVVLFVVPVVKFVLFVVLCLLPAREAKSVSQPRKGLVLNILRSLIPRHPFGSAAMGIGITLVLTLFAIGFGTSVLGDYGWSLFIGLPFCMGFFSVLVYGFHESRRMGKCLMVALYTVVLAGGTLLLFAFEGIICLIMAAPLAVLMAVLGGLVGYAVQAGFRWHDESPRLYCSIILLVPLAMTGEHFQSPEAPLLVVKSSVEVNAPPEVVWQNVVTFAELPPAREWLFRSGIAYPIRAEIQGQGRGAIRYCVFSTGPFVEPIEVWDEPNLLRFSVTENPPPMEELTPYQHIHPPHLDGFLVSKAGQFHLTQLTNGHTLLEGTTWYQHHLWPVSYWQYWSDYIIHRIHLRVLNHVKALSERDQSNVANPVAVPTAPEREKL